MDTMKNETGYAHFNYAASLEEFGAPRRLPQCGGWVLERAVPGASSRDAMSCYPFFVCREWSNLDADLKTIGNELVSLALVTDPFGDYDVAYLRSCFEDVCVPFKEHFVVDLGREPSDFVEPHHRRNTRRALRHVSIEVSPDPTRLIDDWFSLYSNLIARHRIRGLAAFSRDSFVKQLAVPGITALRAARDDETVGMTLWYADDSVAYYHLGAYSDQGYDLGASFALFWLALEHFSSLHLEWLSLGAGAGVRGNQNDGLSRFKRGWSTGTRTAYMCGRILDRARYEKITEARGVKGTDYFPAYRQDEFV